MSMSVVTVVNPGGDRRGTGFVVYISPQAVLVMTNEHVVVGFENAQVIFPGENKRYEAQVRHTNNPLDIALLRFVPDQKCLGCVPLKFAELNTPLNCGDVQMIGYYAVPLGRLLHPGVFDGQICGDPAAGFIKCNYPSESGSSGGPVLKGGRVVGVNCRRAGGIKFAASVVAVHTACGEWLNMGNNDTGFDGMLTRFAQE